MSAIPSVARLSGVEPRNMSHALRRPRAFRRRTSALTRAASADGSGTARACRRSCRPRSRARRRAARGSHAGAHARAHRGGDVGFGQPVDDDLEHADAVSSAELAVDQPRSVGQKASLVEAHRALVLAADLGARAHDAAGKRHDHVGHARIAATAASAAASAALSVRARSRRLPPPTALLTRPVVSSRRTRRP